MECCRTGCRYYRPIIPTKCTYYPTGAGIRSCNGYLPKSEEDEEVFADLFEGLQMEEDKPLTKTQQEIVEVCEVIKDLLLEKNRKYGDSAINPVRIFSNASPVEQIKVRLDDKLSRLRSGQIDDTEDVVDDLIGYLVLWKVAENLKKEEVHEELFG